MLKVLEGLETCPQKFELRLPVLCFNQYMQHFAQEYNAEYKVYLDNNRNNSVFLIFWISSSCNMTVVNGGFRRRDNN